MVIDFEKLINKFYFMTYSNWFLLNEIFQNYFKPPKVVLPYQLLTQEQLFMMVVDKVLADRKSVV